MPAWAPKSTSVSLIRASLIRVSLINVSRNICTNPSALGCLRLFLKVRTPPTLTPRMRFFFLAELTSRQHGDRWLTDLLRGSSAPHFPQAANALARAVKANDTGEYDVSRQEAALAEQLFRASGNMAGALRAEFEQSFADQISRRSEDCRSRSITAGAESKRYSYPWLQIQL